MHYLYSLLFIILIYAASCVALAEVSYKLTGDFVQGGLVYGQTEPGSIVKINNHEVRVSKNGEFIIGFGRDYPKNSMLSIHSKDGSITQHELQVAQREYEIQHINGLPNAQVNPDKETLVRIKQEQESIRKARNLDEDRLDFNSGFIWPAQGPITGVFGSQRILNGEPRQPHYGIDVAAPVGTPVVAPAAGVVTYVADMYFSGGTLVLDHGHRLSSSFLHLEKILVEVGDRVKQGDKIALVGATGRVTGAHLDWRMNWHQQRIDPGLLMGNDEKSNK